MTTRAMRTRPGRILALAVVSVALVTASGCARSSEGPLLPMKVGLVPSEDSLPLWVGERDGLFRKAGVDLSLVEFASTRERDAALTAGDVDAIVADVVVAARMRAAGQGVRIPTVLLGAEPSQGRYGIAVRPKSAVTSLSSLAGKPIATSRGSLEDYVLDSMMLFSGLGPAEIKTKDIADPAERLDALVSGQIDAALLPDPFLSLAERRGAKVIAEDTRDVNLSVSVLVVRERFLDTSDGTKATAQLLTGLKDASAAIDADPASFRSLLAERIPAIKPIATSYKVSEYPAPVLPALEDVEATLDWMTRSGLLRQELLYESFVWSPPAAK